MARKSVLTPMRNNLAIIMLILLVLVAIEGANQHKQSKIQVAEDLRTPAMDLNKIDYGKKENYTFKFKYQGKSLEITEKDMTWENAYRSASKKCFKHFYPKFESEEKGLDVIDVCANPRY